MTTKNIEFVAVFDTKQAERDIQRMQEKVKNMTTTGYDVANRAKTIYGQDSPYSERTQKLFESMNKATLDHLRKEFSEREKIYSVQNAQLKSVEDRLSRANKLTQEHLTLLSQKRDIQENLLRLQKEQNDVASQYKNIKGSIEGLGVGDGGGGGTTPTGGGTGDGDGGGGGFLGGLRGGWGALMKAYFGFQVAQQATNMIGDVFKSEQTRSKIEANVAGLELTVSGRREELTGGYLREKFFEGQRARGIEEAQGAAVQTGTFIKNSFEAAWEGLKVEMLNPNKAGNLFDVLKGDSESVKVMRDVFKKGQLESEKESIEAQIAKDPKMGIAFDYLAQRASKFAQVQQMSGMSMNQLVGPQGLLSSAGGMFTEEQKLGAMQQIYGAGGSTAQGRAAGQALQLRREFGLQGSAGYLGALSSGIGGGQTGAESVLRKVLAEAFSQGLDSSKFSRETEKMVELTTKFIERSGARTEEEMLRVADSLTKSLTGTSMKDIEDVGKAEDIFQNRLGKGASSYSKAVQLQSMRGHEKLGTLPEITRVGLTNVSPGELQAGSPYLRSIAKASGYEDYDEFVQDVMSQKMDSMVIDPQTRSVINQMKSFQSKEAQLKKQLKRETSPIMQGLLKKDLEDVQKQRQALAESKSGSAAASTLSQYGYTPESFYSAETGLGVYAKGTKTEEELQEERRERSYVMAPEERVGVKGRKMEAFDYAEMTIAKGQQEELKNAMDYMPQFKTAVKDVAEITEALAVSLRKLVVSTGGEVPQTPLTPQQIQANQQLLDFLFQGTPMVKNND